mmetsp:Transcript_2916/g.3990  ORF Transcript_2916/g.3990 Transcript_2916/m.3990 type:complete len:176 (-) Transcript_2916:1314-1841(-)
MLWDASRLQHSRAYNQPSGTSSMCKRATMPLPNTQRGRSRPHPFRTGALLIGSHGHFTPCFPTEQWILAPPLCSVANNFSRAVGLEHALSVMVSTFHGYARLASEYELQGVLQPTLSPSQSKTNEIAERGGSLMIVEWAVQSNHFELSNSVRLARRLRPLGLPFLVYFSHRYKRW